MENPVFTDYDILDTNEKIWMLKLESILEHSKVILSDIFDTVILRTTDAYEPVDYHYILKQLDIELHTQLGITAAEHVFNYDDKRTQVAKEVRMNNPYYSLNDIASRMPVALTYVPCMEASVDMEYLRPSLFGYALLQMCSRTSLSTVNYFLSDTYYSKPVVYRFLNKCFTGTVDKLAAWGCLVSASDRLAKSDGTMYDHIRELFPKIPSSKFIMFSDRVEDLEMAAKYGIKGVLVKTTPYIQYAHAHLFDK